MTNSRYPKEIDSRSRTLVMRISQSGKRFLRLGLLVLSAALSYWICSIPAETVPRVITSDERPPMYVLQVGIGKYKYTPTWAELRGAVTDVVEMRKVLEGERWQIPPANIVTLTDGDGTKQRIFETFQTHLIANAKKHFDAVKDRQKGAVVLFQFSGHGSQVPDVDGDEKDDRKDETLVTVDSQDLPGKNFDITDDEIYALTTQLRQWTDNIVYVFDSCHSGSGTRNAEDVRRLPERKTTPVAVAGVGAATRSGSAKEEDGASGVMPPGDDYIVITAARANELASQKNCFEECGSSTRPVVFGNLTFYLIDELKNARSDTSYRELMENVTRRVVADKPTQTPQLEGDKSRFVFDSLGRTEDNFVRIIGSEIKKPNGTRSVTIAAGAMQGVTVGTLISFYDKAVPRFDGAEIVSSGRVATVGPSDSIVTLSGPKREINTGDKAVVLAPDLGSVRLKVDLGIDAAKFSTGENQLVGTLRDLMVPPGTAGKGEIDLVTTRAGQPARWDVALLKDKFSNVVTKIPGARLDTFACLAPRASDKDAKAPTGGPDRDVFYIAGQDFVPLFGFCMETDVPDRVVAAERLRKAFAHLAGLKTINSISNKRSLLSKKITVTPVKLGGSITCLQSKLNVTAPVNSVPEAATGHHKFEPREPVWFEVVNNSTKALYVALLNVDPSGAVILMSPRKRADEQEGVVIPPGGKRVLPADDCRTENGRIVEAGAFRASRTQGLDRFKFIFSTESIIHDDFAYLERPPLAGTRGRQATLGSDWTTIETIFQVGDTRN